MLLVGVTLKLCFSKYMVRTPFNIKVFFPQILSIAGVIVLIFLNGFIYELLGLVLLGSCTSLGEVTMLSYLRTFPGKAVRYWSSGHGLSGVLTSLGYVYIRHLGILDRTVYNKYYKNIINN